MAEFKKLVITNKGQSLMAKLIAGKSKVEFTKISVSTNIYNESQILGLTSLANVKQSGEISKVTRINDVAVQIESAIENSKLTTGYNLNSLGLYAKDPDDGEILYAVASVESADKGAYMPPFNGQTVSGAYFKLTTTVSNAENVTLQVDPSAVATVGDIQELQKQIADLQAFIGYTDNHIFGVEVDFTNKKFTRLAGAFGKTPGANFDAIHCFGGRRRCNVTNDGKVVAYYGEDGYSETGKLTKQIVIEEGHNAGTYPAGTIVQVMVEQPRFYYKVVPLDLEIQDEGEDHGHLIRKARYYISDEPETDFKLHPAFIRNGVEHDVIYKSAYEGSLFDTSAGTYILDDAQVADFTEDLLCSIANAKPISGHTQLLTRANTRKLAQKRGAGWEQEYAAANAATQLLMLIEYASFNMQSAIGAGNTSKQDDSSTNMAENTGATNSLGNGSGSVSNVNSINIVSYRGEENPYGNIWKWVDGMNIVNPSPFAEGQFGRVYIADHDFADNKTDGAYEDTGICPAYGEGYISAFGYNSKYDWLFIPGEYKGNSSTPVGDYAWNKNAGNRVARVGGDWSYGAKAGAFCLYLGGDASTRGRDVGGRLVYVPHVSA